MRDAQVSTLRRRVSAFGRAPNLRVDAVVEGGRIRIDGSSDLADQGVVIDALVRAKDVPIARLDPYLASLGWSVHRAPVGPAPLPARSGTARSADRPAPRCAASRFRCPALDEPALAVRRVEVEVDAIDLLQHRVGVGALSLHGARLALRPDLGGPDPAARRGLVRAAAGVADAAPATEPGRSRRPWSWTIGHVTTPFARLHVAGDDGDVVLAASMSGESIGPGAYWSPLRAWVGRGGGVAVFDGTARMTRGLTIDGRLTASDVDVPGVARAVGMPFAELVQAGSATADLTVEIEPGAAKDPVDVRGKIAVERPLARRSRRGRVRARRGRGPAHPRGDRAARERSAQPVVRRGAHLGCGRAARRTRCSRGRRRAGCCRPSRPLPHPGDQTASTRPPTAPAPSATAAAERRRGRRPCGGAGDAPEVPPRRRGRRSPECAPAAAACCWSTPPASRPTPSTSRSSKAGRRTCACRRDGRQLRRAGQRPAPRQRRARRHGRTRVAARSSSRRNRSRSRR